ncbi:MAG TPA: LapA family protein [bacterium]|nr:LapA family protein [bacterium]
MGLVKIFISIVVMGVLLWFLALNVDQTVQELQLFTLTLYDVNIVHIILASFLVGILLGFLLPVMQVVQAKSDSRRYERDNRRLRQELNDLRNVSIEEELEQLPEKASGEEEELHGEPVE